MRPRINLFLTMAILSLTALRGQSSGYFDHFGIKEGLSQSTVIGMLQDRFGFIWIGTQDGLNRFDGAGNTIFTNEPFQGNTLLGNHVMDLTMDSQGKIWVATLGGVDCIDPANLGVTHMIDLRACEKFQRISKIWFVDTTLFLGTDRGLFKGSARNPMDFEVIKNNMTCDDIFSVFYAKKINEFESMVSTSCGIGRVSENSGTIERWIELDGFRQSRAAEVSGDNLFFSDGATLYSSNIHQASSRAEILHCSAIIKSIAHRSNGELWVATDGDGIYVLSACGTSYQLLKHFFFNHDPREYFQCNYVTRLLADNSFDRNNIWIGTHDEGVYCYNDAKNYFDFFSMQHNLLEPNYFGIAEDKEGDIWVSALDSIYHVKRTGAVRGIDITKITREIALPVENLYCDSSNQIWFGHGDNLYRINRKTYEPELIVKGMFGGKMNQVFRMVELDAGRILIGTSLGLAIYNIAVNDLDTMTVIGRAGQEFKVSRINALFVDKDRNWWIKGTNGGVVFYNTSDKSARLFNHDPDDPHSLISDLVLAIDQLPGGEMIMGTASGISILEDFRSGRFRSYSKAHGLQNSFVYSVLPDRNGRVWASTNLGVHVFDPVNETFLCYNAKSGGYIDEFNSGGYCVTRRGTFLFSGIGGVIEIDPGAMIPGGDSLPVYVTFSGAALSSAVSTFSGSRRIELDYDNSGLEFRAEVPSYFDDDIIIIYHIKELDTTWQKMLRGETFRQVNLAPGNYTLVISALDPSGQTFFKASEFTITVHPPFYSTLWFYISSLCVAVLVVLLIYRVALKRRLQRLAEIERVRAEENDRVRKAAAMDLHDEFGNGLTRISMLIEMIRDKLPGNIEDAQKDLDLVSENSKRLYNGTKDFIWSVNPANESLYETLIRIKDYADELFSGTSVSFELKDVDEKLHGVKNHPAFNRNIVMIFKEALSNVLKHAQATHVELRIYPDSEYLYITMKDNGRGFDVKGANGSGFGLGNIAARAKKISGEAELISEPRKGTKLTLKIKNSGNQNCTYRG